MTHIATLSLRFALGVITRAIFICWLCLLAAALFALAMTF